MAGKQWDRNLVGPRFPGRNLGPGDDIADPALGERVTRCRTCGSPDTEERHLMVFGLMLRGRPAGRYEICGPCWQIANPPEPRTTDPLRAA